MRHLVVLINKMDDPTVNWSEDRYKECKEKIQPFLRKSGFKNDEMYFMPCSGYTGAFLAEVPPEDVCPWFRSVAGVSTFFVSHFRILSQTPE